MKWLDNAPKAQPAAPATAAIQGERQEEAA